MAGSLVDLSEPGLALPDRLVVDSNIVIDWLLAEGDAVARGTPAGSGQERVIRFVSRFQQERRTGVITSTSAAEIFHFILKLAYRRALVDYRPDIAVRYPGLRRPSWDHLFKARSDLVKRFAGVLDDARRSILAAGIVFLQPDDLGPIPSGRPLENELVRTMERYELDSNDAAILVEARRAGVAAVATADRDLHRARLDFDVYTWM